MKQGMWRLVLLVLGVSACSARAGMYCQQDSDCRTGLVCMRPPADGALLDGGTFGICEPARHGVGEVCLWSSECQAQLLCSNVRGEFTGDGRHGRCVVSGDGAVDGAAAADLGPTDAALPDGGGGDGGALDGASGG